MTGSAALDPVCVWRSPWSWLIHKLDTTWPDIYMEPTHDTSFPRWSQYSHTLHCQLPGKQYKIRTIPVTETWAGEDANNLDRVDNFLGWKETLRPHQDNHEDQNMILFIPWQPQHCAALNTHSWSLTLDTEAQIKYKAKLRKLGFISTLDLKHNLHVMFSCEEIKIVLVQALLIRGLNCLFVLILEDLFPIAQRLPRNHTIVNRYYHSHHHDSALNSWPNAKIFSTITRGQQHH